MKRWLMSVIAVLMVTGCTGSQVPPPTLAPAPVDRQTEQCGVEVVLHGTGYGADTREDNYGERGVFQMACETLERIAYTSVPDREPRVYFRLSDCDGPVSHI